MVQWWAMLERFHLWRTKCCLVVMLHFFKFLILPFTSSTFKWEVGVPSGVPAGVSQLRRQCLPLSALLLLEKGELSAPLSSKAFLSLLSAWSVCEITPLFYWEGNIPCSALSILKDKSILCQSLFSLLSALRLWISCMQGVCKVLHSGNSSALPRRVNSSMDVRQCLTLYLTQE